MRTAALLALLLSSEACTSAAKGHDGEPVEQRPSTRGYGDLNAHPGMLGRVDYVRKNTVRVNAGSRDGVHEGDALHIWRSIPRAHVGRLRIDTVHARVAWGTFISSSAVECLWPTPGDIAADDSY
jgi:hypothetical protein